MTPGLAHSARYWHALSDGRIQCDLCPRYCKLADGQHGLCLVRENQAGQMVLPAYGRSSGLAVDPIEKKPLNHFLPGSQILSFGTAGCNLTCKFCQNWDISKARALDRLSVEADADTIADMALAMGCRSVAFTYNDPVIFLEFAVDTARACRERGIKTAAVTAGYIATEARREFFAHMDAANVDLKAFSEDFYHKICGGHLDAVLDTLSYIKRETETWLEITTLLVPGENDSDAEIDRLTQWVATSLGPDVPLHFTAFHPAWKMSEKPPTAFSTLSRARSRALANGLRHVYTGNVQDETGASTWCPGCGDLLIGRDWHSVTSWNLAAGGSCPSCGTAIAGVFEAAPELGAGNRGLFPVRF